MGDTSLMGKVGEKYSSVIIKVCNHSIRPIAWVLYQGIRPIGWIDPFNKNGGIGSKSENIGNAESQDKCIQTGESLKNCSCPDCINRRHGY